jgi:hypothetical protein
VTGNRSLSESVRLQIAQKLISECGLDITLEQDQWGNPKGFDRHVPFQFHTHWLEKPYITLAEFLAKRFNLASDSTQGEWLNTLLGRIESVISFEEQQPIAPELLPEYIDVTADVSTGRASFEEPHKMFEGHAALDEERKAIAEFEQAPTQPQPGEFHCRIGKSYPKVSFTFSA